MLKSEGSIRISRQVARKSARGRRPEQRVHLLLSPDLMTALVPWITHICSITYLPPGSLRALKPHLVLNPSPWIQYGDKIHAECLKGCMKCMVTHAGGPATL